MRKNILKKLNEIFKDVFNDDDIIISESTTSEEIENWDSITHITLIGSVEDEFGIRFDMNKISEMKKVRNLIDYIEEMV